MRESRLHKGKPKDISKTGQRDSFNRAVRSVESAMQENREREKDPSLISVNNSQDFFCAPIAFQPCYCHTSRLDFARSALGVRCVLASLSLPTLPSQYQPQDRGMLLKATRGRVRTPKASRNLAPQPGLYRSRFSFAQGAAAIQRAAAEH